jgi:hypothetical protein
VNPLCRYPLPGPGFEVFTPSSAHKPLKFILHTLSGLDSPSESHQPIAMSCHASSPRLTTHSFRGLFPCGVYPATQSYIPPTVPKPLVTLRPQAFSTSRRFAPQVTYWVYFIPNPPVGLPIRGFNPLSMPYAFSSAVASMKLVIQAYTLTEAKVAP